MKIELSKEHKVELEKRHRVERDGHIRDRIKAVLLCVENRTGEEIAQALRIHQETVYEHLKDYRTQDKLAPTNGGLESSFIQAQTEELRCRFETNLYATVQDIWRYVQETYGVKCSVPGMTKRL